LAAKYKTTRTAPENPSFDSSITQNMKRRDIGSNDSGTDEKKSDKEISDGPIFQPFGQQSVLKPKKTIKFGDLSKPATVVSPLPTDPRQVSLPPQDQPLPLSIDTTPPEETTTTTTGNRFTAPKWPTFQDWSAMDIKGRFFPAKADDGKKNDVIATFPGGNERDHQGNRDPASNLWTSYYDPQSMIAQSKKKSYVAAAAAWIVYDHNLPEDQRQVPYFVEAIKVT